MERIGTRGEEGQRLIKKIRGRERKKEKGERKKKKRRNRKK